MGNIYAAEALYLAGIHPFRPANRVTRDEAAALHAAIRTVLRAAIDHGGTTIRDYRNADGVEGAYARRLHVYGREGEPCLACGDTVRRLCLDGSNRQPKFIVPSIADRLQEGAGISGLGLESALWCRYCFGNLFYWR